MRTRLTIMGIVLAAVATAVGTIGALSALFGWRGLATGVLGAVAILVGYRLLVQQPRQPSQHRTVSPVQSGSGHPPAQHRKLVAQQQELGILGCRTSRQQRKPPHHLAEHQVHQSQGHPPIIATR